VENAVRSRDATTDGVIATHGSYHGRTGDGCDE
jgi:4-aminobutyrate aminotransferase-like enzyme